MNLFTATTLTPREYIIKFTHVYLGLKKNMTDEKMKANMNEDNIAAVDEFVKHQGMNHFLVAQNNGDIVKFVSEPPAPESIKKKSLLILKCRTGADVPEIDAENVDREVIIMEINKKILENLYLICNEIYMPVLGNPLNMIGWSDLVTKDLMDKFHVFLAHTYVTLGQVEGRTMLPLPPNDVTSVEKTSSKDKANLLENAIVHWTKQIKNVLKRDPETVLKTGDHPGPLSELEFWQNKSEDLQSICGQLGSERIKRVLKFLEQNKSTYTGPFSKLQKEVQVARNEAVENYKYLTTLSDLFHDLISTGTDLPEVIDLFAPIMQTILLIWQYSQHYNTPARLVVLIREICNAIIIRCRDAITGFAIFDLIKAEEPRQAHDQLTVAFDVCAKFKDAYFEYKQKAKGQWKITTNALFVRLDSFSERCQDIMHLTSTIIQFSKLTKIELGNTKGKTLTDIKFQISSEFEKAVEEFTSVTFDIMDIEKREFDDHYFKFRQRMKELDRRLASILTQGFDDSDTIIGKFKLLDSFEGLLSRTIIQDELERKHITLLDLYKQDLKIVSTIFIEGKLLVDKQDEKAPISNNLPPIAGSLNWTKGLLERIKEPMDKLTQLSQSVQDREEYKDVQKLYASLHKNIKEYDAYKITQWEASVSEQTDDNLNKCLLVREEATDKVEEGFVRVNFDPILIRLLREVKYLQLLDIDVPEKAALLYKNVNTYRTQKGNLDIIVDIYNEILRTLLPVEKPLLSDRIQRINKALEPGIADLRWNSPGIDPFIKNAMEVVTDVDELVRLMKDNVRKMQQMMVKWKDSLFDRRMKPFPPDELEQNHQSLVGPKLEDIKIHGKEIHRLLKVTQENIKPDKKSRSWLSYVDYVNGLVIEGITEGIQGSMKYLADQINIKYNAIHGNPPIFEIRVDLEDLENGKRTVVFDPTIQSNSRENGIRDILQKIIDDFISIAIQIPGRIDSSYTTGDYLVEIKDQFQLYGAMQVIQNNFHEIELATESFIDQYKEMDFLWKETLAESFEAFLNTGDDPREAKHVYLNDDGEEIEDETFKWMADRILGSVSTKKPTLEHFDERITFLNSIKNDIAGMKTVIDIGWLRVHATPLIKELQNTVTQWIDRYTSFLMDNTVAEINNIQNFIEEVSTGIKVIPDAAESKKEKELLMKVMEHVRDVKMIRDRTFNEIEPMKQTIMLLKKHQLKMDEDFLVKLENSKTALVDVSEKALGPVKEQILPLQNQEAGNIKQRLSKFNVQVQEFRIDFQNNCPYHLTDSSTEIINKAYETTGEYYQKTLALEDEAKTLNNLETLFDMQKSTYKALKDCRNDLQNLKQMWDLISLIDYQFETWKSTLWDKIDTDNLMSQIKDMQTKQCNPQAPQNKEIKNFKAFFALNDRVKNMNTILPLISQLHSKFMQERHWKKLMRITGQKIDFQSPSFCLEDLIKLQLYRYAEEVTEIVDGAQKESKIETKLNVIQSTWEEQKFDFKEYKEVPILGDLGDIIEFVEQHQMEIMGMMSSKDVEEFKERAIHWQKNLKQVEQGISIWTKVQRKWVQLEPIFLASEDIRAQLPDDTRRFEQIDGAFKEMMREAQAEPGVIEACTYEGREELLNNTFDEIEVCEKALNEYLEQKKKIFARFYFVSNQALLDILSNGNNPEKVDEYLGDCFDGMKRLEFIKGPGIPYPSKRAKGMFSNEGEYVPFEHNFEAVGAVENYLNDLQTKMQVTLRDVLDTAKQTADMWEFEKQRHVWLEDYCAQIALLATCVMWTEETGRAFDEHEGGSETAMRDYFNMIVLRIANLIERVRTPLSMDLRVKIITVITIDVHSRDVVDRFCAQKMYDQQGFSWQSQLKCYMEYKNPKDEKRVCVIKICDWTTYYNYEYVGNCGRLVITPLTDRCYITLSQALNLSMGAAPAGPAGTGKTETTKDLGRNLGLHVVVFNCSDQMNYRSMAQIFMGLAQTGAWGCFDEFNRISIEVLSVVSTQVKYVLDAVKEMKLNPAKNTFIFQADQDEEISLKITVGFFITMNPGYAGRTELPENLKALFRSCAMVVPDIVLICENMLMSEGFSTAKELSKKFMTLYNLSKSLLSAQIHYDWGLRAVKSVLRQAGGLKRAEPDVPEDYILRRGLKDFNWPKIIVDDRAIFAGLIGDLFPGIPDESKIDLELQAKVRVATKEEGLQPEDGFVLKVVQTAEILEVRHCMFIIGNPGCAKSTIWKVLGKTLTNNGHLTVTDIVDPKAVTADELYGCMNPKTKEWKDGVLSVIMRDMNKNNPPYKPSQKYKWIILDGDVDPEWIESLNTVMDDNKVLTLVSQERIPMTPEMRLILEISNLRNATPATVSRGGVLFVNDSDIGCRPYFDSWLAKYKKIENGLPENVFTLAYTHYLSDSFTDDLRHKSKITPNCDMQSMHSLACIVDEMDRVLHSDKAQYEHLKKLREENAEDAIKLIYEGFFVFAGMWAYGASLDEDKIQFSNQWKSLSGKYFKYEGDLQCFDYFFDPISASFVNWKEKVVKFNTEYEGLFSNMVVPTAETTRQSFLMDLHVQHKKGMLFVGAAGTGKTTIIKDYFSTLDKEKTIFAAINFNSYTDSKAMQVVIESQVDKRSGVIFGPPLGKILIYFMDDLNMPYLDKYGTQSPICLVRQIIDYGLVYDRDHLEEKKKLLDIMFCACMNPKSGSFVVDLRLTRHMTLVACLTAEKDILSTIYFQILDNHLKTFDKPNAELSRKIINATMTVFVGVATSPQFAPTAKKFHYQFNLRDFSKIVENISLAQAGHYRGQPLGLIRLWAHECHRTWRDRLIDEEDTKLYMTYMTNSCKEFTDIKPDDIFEEPLIYTSFVAACEGHESAYLPIKSMEHLNQVLEGKLEEYNEQIASMNLVLFAQAMCHITRIGRIVDLAAGSALLVGVGGSGKQSLAKLTAFILGYDIARIVVTSSYKLADLKVDIQTMFTKSGAQGNALLFILTDAQITDDKFLVYINDLLSSGYIPELFAKDELDALLGKVRAEAKGCGVEDTPDELFKFLLDKVRKNLHLSLCFSPVGDAFRIRARMFPGIINCTSMDWFHEWPSDALIDVANRFLADIEFPEDDIRTNIALHMAHVHLSISDANAEFLASERRHNYTTPTSFLELINFYKMLVDSKRGKITEQITKLETGLQIMRSTTEKVEGIQKLMEVKMIDVGIEKEKTNELIEVVGKESLIAEKEADAAAIQQEETEKMTQAAKEKKASCDAELADAIPAMEKAQDAVNCLNVGSIQELKSLGSPPEQAKQVSFAVMILKDGVMKNHNWANAQKMMKDPKKFIDEIVAFDGDNIEDKRLDGLKPLLSQDWFNFEVMKGKSVAAAYLCSWIVNIVGYNTIFKKVKPLKDSADEAQATADAKGEELKVVIEKVRQINEHVDNLKAKLAEAEANKKRVEDEAEGLNAQLSLANRLVNGLADENVRWNGNVGTLGGERVTMIGDALISAAFVSYIGPFSYSFRDKLWKEVWLDDIIEKKIPYTKGVDPLGVLATPSEQAVWQGEGLPADRVSLENAAVVTSCNRYPLIIDPQLQGQKWIKGRVGADLITIQLSQKGWLKRVEMAVSNGNVLMIEAIGEEIDAILDPLLSRQFVKKGKQLTVKLGSEDVDMSPNFQLYLQTKLSNPHYKPETAAQCTIINFIVTEAGLEDQLLASVVKVEKPDLEHEKEELVTRQNEYKITLANLEAALLQNLSEADPATILQNTALIESLEDTKKTSMEIQEQQAIAKETEVTINTLREIYRRVAAEGAMLYFLLIVLNNVAHMYQYSLESFTTFFFKAIEKTAAFDEEEHRVLALRDSIRMTIYQWVARGLFEKHKQIFRSQLTFRLMQKKIVTVEYTDREMHFLLNAPTKTDTVNPMKDWLPDIAWFSMQKLIEIEGFENFANDVVGGAPTRFKDWYNELQPEDVKLPLDWKALDQRLFQKLLVIRVLRPDRQTIALDNFCRRTLPHGDDFVDCDATSSFFQILTAAYNDSTPATPIYFILSPGANPVLDVQNLARQCGMDPSKTLHTIALGQGVEPIAHAKLEIGHKEGHWVMLQNIHLMPAFLIDLEKKLDGFAIEVSNPGFRLFVSSDPATSIPIGLLERAIKLTNEPPQGLKQNLKRAFVFFNREDVDDKDPKIRTILFGLCYFHSVMLERKKFGPKGWNMSYPFSIGDLRDSSTVLNNYMETTASSGKIPWDDLRYLVGEILYGGHIVDNVDRRFCAAFLENLMTERILEEEELFPFIEGRNISFKCPPPLQYEKYLEHIDQECPPETPLAYGLHPNAEIDFRTSQCLELFKTLQEIQPKDGGAQEGGGRGPNDAVLEFMQRTFEEVNIESFRFPMDDIASKMGEETRGPFQNSFMQECEYMNILIHYIVRSLRDIELAFKGELTMTENMENIMGDINLNRVPALWTKYGFTSTRGLNSWLTNTKHRCEQLAAWKEDPVKLPHVTFINRLKNPNSFLTAIKQVYAREKQQELNKLIIVTDVLKKLYWEPDLAPCKDGAYVFGCQVEGARWEASVGQLDESLPKKLYSVCPVINCRSAPLPPDGKEDKTVYQCPVYMTTSRGATFVFYAQLKTKHPPAKWILAGVALILDVEGISDAYRPDQQIGLA